MRHHPVRSVFGVRKHLIYRQSLEYGDAEDLENCVEAEVQIESLLDDGDEHVDGDRDPDLRPHGVLGGAVEGFDAQVLLDPFEEQLDLPAASIELGDGRCWEGPVVGQEDQGLASLGVADLDAPQLVGIAVGRGDAGEHDGLVADDPGGAVDRVRVKTAQLSVGFGAHDEEGVRPVQGVEPGEVHVGPVHDVEGAGLGHQQVHDVDVVELAGGDVDEGRDGAAQVEKCVQLDRRLGLAEVGPREQRETQIDG